MIIGIEHDLLVSVIKQSEAGYLLSEVSFVDTLIDQHRREARAALATGNPAEQLRYQILDAYAEFGKAIQRALMDGVAEKIAGFGEVENDNH